MDRNACYRWLFGGCCSILLHFLGQNCCPGQIADIAQLPSESRLPGEKALVASLPGEATLPDMRFAQKDAPSTKEAPKLPGESRLPGSGEPDDKEPVGKKPNGEKPDGNEPDGQTTESDDGQEPVNEDLLRLRRSPDERPWLRLRTSGHIGTIRTMAFTSDSQRLCTAGDDKQLLIWRRADQQDDAGGAAWQLERTVRWQIQRGRRGRIYDMVTAPGLVIFGGAGAMGELGEILLVDPNSGNLSHVLHDVNVGHRQRLTSLAIASQPNVTGVASMDNDGKLLYWQRNPDTGQWRPKVLAYDEKTAKSLQDPRLLHPIAMPDAQHVIAPKYVGRDKQRYCLWQLERIHVGTVEKRSLGDSSTVHRRKVTAMAVSAKGTRLASADEDGNLFIWTLGRRVKPQKLTPRSSQVAPILSLAFSPTGRTLVAGMLNASRGAIRIYDLRKMKYHEIPVPRGVFACCISPDGRYFAYSVGSDVVIRSLLQPQTVVSRLRSPVHAPLRVALPKRQPYYRLGFGTRRKPDGSIPLEDVFDTGQVQLERNNQANEQSWLPTEGQSGDWKLDGIRYLLTKAGRRKASIPLTVAEHGSPAAKYWISDRKGNPFALALGTTNGNIYVFRLAENGVCPLLRQFYGHIGGITSLGVTADLRYLASGSHDGTMRIWRLDGAAAHPADRVMVDRWGAQFAREDDRVVVASIREDGPLYFRGMRRGDVVKKLRLPTRAQQDIPEVDNPRDVLAALRDNPWDRLVAFEYQRGRSEPRSFQMFPAWQPAVSLHVADNGEWAYWTPAGYYDASFEGHKLFGWQVNRGLDTLPDFFLAAQLRKRLERPRVMARLLESGSLEEAFRQAHIPPPTAPHHLVMNQYRVKPRVEILSPAAGQSVNSPTVKVMAKVAIRNGQQLVPPKAFANGVVALNRRLVRQQRDEEGLSYEYAWDARLPSDPTIRIQVAASTDAEVVDEASVTIVRQRPPRPTQRSRVFLAAAGINQYRDARLPRLDLAVNNTVALMETFQRQLLPSQQLRAVSLLDGNVTRPTWTVTMERYADELRGPISPDDLLVVFLTGHGIRDATGDQYYYITSDARYSDIAARRFESCLSFDSFSLFADLPCRKLVILDTCHSGAVQPLRQRELKTALRALQDDLVFTLTASEGNQEAVEGRFARRLLEALQGQADMQGNRDGVVSLAETVRYVKRMVSADSATDKYRQIPTAGPVDLISLVEMPLTSAGQSVSASERRPQVRAMSSRKTSWTAPR